VFVVRSLLVVTHDEHVPKRINPSWLLHIHGDMLRSSAPHTVKDHAGCLQAIRILCVRIANNVADQLDCI
jgi:hypothetical protein